MAFKLAITLAVLALASASNVEYKAPAEYQFGYSVHDSLTGDVKSQQETRLGDSVRGQYSLIEPTGTRRIVDYSADAHTGFNAQVRREGLALAPAAIAVKAAPVAIAAPAIITKTAAPLAVEAAPAFAYAAAPTFAYAARPSGISQTISQQYVARAAAPLAFAGPAPLAYSAGFAAPFTSYAAHAAPLSYTAGVPIAYAGFGGNFQAYH